MPELASRMRKDSADFPGVACFCDQNQMTATAGRIHVIKKSAGPATIFSEPKYSQPYIETRIGYEMTIISKVSMMVAPTRTQNPAYSTSNSSIDTPIKNLTVWGCSGGASAKTVCRRLVSHFSFSSGPICIRNEFDLFRDKWSLALGAGFLLS